MKNEIKLWLTKSDTDRWVLSFFLPVVQKIRGTKRIGVYPNPGDPIWLPHLCSLIIEIAGQEAKELEIGESMKVQITVT